MPLRYEDLEIPIEEGHGILDPAVEYEWTIVEINLKDVVIRGENKGDDYEDLTDDERLDVKDNDHAKILEMTSTVGEELGISARIRTSFWVDTIKYNAEKPEYDSNLLTFIRKLGYDPALKNPDGTQTTLKPIDYVKVGTRFKAHPEPQIDKKTNKESGFHQLNTETVVPLSGVVGTSTLGSVQAPIPGATSEATKEDIIKFASAFETKQEAMRAISNTQGYSQSLGVFLQMCKDGEIVFK